LYYYDGTGVEKDVKKGRFHDEQAAMAMAGNVFSR
jgi:hypothetical protein